MLLKIGLFLLCASAMLTHVAIAQHTHHMDMGGMAGMDMSDMEMPVKTAKNPYLIMMNKMMQDMGVVDVKCCRNMNFLAQMNAHHQGAIDMAEYEIQHGKNPQMVALAKSILTEQRAEKQEMTALMDYYHNRPKKHKITPEYTSAMNKTMTDMMKNMPTELGEGTDIDFARVMIPHHQAAIDMSVALLNFDVDPMMTARAKKIITDQQTEINQMKAFVK